MFSLTACHDEERQTQVCHHEAMWGQSNDTYETARDHGMHSIYWHCVD